MMQTEKFDLVAIGTGSAASGVTFRLKKAGWNVAAVEKLPPGGTCSQWGCDPKKVLLAGAEVIDSINRLGPKGVEAESPRIVWPQLMEFKKEFTESIPDSTRKKYADAGVPLYEGHASFEGPNVIRVGEHLLSAKHIHLGCGMRPRSLGIAGEEHVLSSRDFLELEALPPRIVFIGGGYVSFEFAHIAARAGSSVTILQRGDRVLHEFDPVLADKMIEASRAAGIDVHLGADVIRVERIDTGVCVNCGGEGAPRVNADIAVHGAGRVPDIMDMNLEDGNVVYTEEGITVNEFLQSTSNSSVTAAGDCAASGAPLTPVAGYQAWIVASNLQNREKKKPVYTGYASVVFTIPELARAGALEEELRAGGVEFHVDEGDTAPLFSNRRINSKVGGYRILTDKKSGNVLGAHLFGHGAAETINLFSLAIRHGLARRELKEVLYSYPSHGSDIKYML